MILGEFFEEKQLYDCLTYFDNYFDPTLSERVKDIKIYSKKLVENAINYYITSENGEIAGFISFYCNDIENKIAYLTLIATNEKFRKKGIGKKLLNICIEKCKERKMKQLKLEVQKNNNIAKNFYKNFGFNVCDENELSFFMIKDI